MAVGERAPREIGFRVVLLCAALVVVIAGLRAVGGLLSPILIAAFLVIVALPALNGLERRGVPSSLSIFIVFAVVVGGFVLLSVIVGQSISDFQSRAADYQARARALIDPWWGWFAEQPYLSVEQLREGFDAGAVFRTFGGWVSALGRMLSNSLLVALLVAFMLAEISGFPAKLRRALGQPDADLGRFTGIVHDVQAYLVVKAQVSLLTGALASIVLVLVGVDFVALWGLMAFLLNFVPTIGSIVAAVPPVFLALIDLGWGAATVVLVAYLLINTVVGNILEPRMMGRKLGLSSLVVLLSLLFWGWVWGILGMLLSVPLTMVVKILLENSDDLRWLAILLEPGGKDDRS